jgi:NADPH:quinone reductase-like Zn-dependent oxidoreductase
VKAIRYHRYGPADVVALEDVDPPTVGDDDVLVRVRAASVNPYDWHMMRGEPRLMRLKFGLRAPRDPRLGIDVAGVVEEVGTGVTEFAVGDEVFGRSEGALAELTAVCAGRLVDKPSNVTFEQAAAVPVAAYTALQALRDGGRIEPGHKVLVNGASGGVGTFAVQIATSFGADVTAVTSTGNLDLMASIGATHVIDYTEEDFTARPSRYDLVFDVIGNHPLSRCRRVVAPGGTYLMIGGVSGRWQAPFDRMLALRLRSLVGRTRMVSVHAHHDADDMRMLRDMLADGVLVPVIDRTYPLSETAEAIRYLEAGHAHGKVIITVSKAAGRVKRRRKNASRTSPASR